ncbi:MAG: hypothetical protein JWO80_5886 [Bryobacterales bacterium]|nr:hypothetical protein [Bryobacterales bacterium]
MKSNSLASLLHAFFHEWMGNQKNLSRSRARPYSLPTRKTVVNGWRAASERLLQNFPSSDPPNFLD